MDTSDKKVVLITGGAMGQGQTHAVEFVSCFLHKDRASQERKRQT